MTQTVATGRHRSAGRHNPLTEIKGIMARAGDTGVKASAVLAASGGLVAAFALPAQAAPSTRTETSGTSAATLTLDTTTAERSAAGVVVAETPAVEAPALAAPTVAESTVAGVTAEPIPAPEPVAAPAPAPAAETSTSGGSAAPKAATVNIPANSGIVGIASSLTGIWYIYGGTTPAGFDCSGFTQYVYAQAGISIPRTASAQQAAATPVSNPQPGDLVFYGYPAYHVGIYIGNGQIIDSLNSSSQTAVRDVGYAGSSYSFGRF